MACLALDGSGRSRGFDGAGYLLGDEGGAFWLGRNGIRRALAADEGRGPATALTTAVADLLGPLDGLASRLHRLPRPVDTIAQFAPTVLAEAAAGDSHGGERSLPMPPTAWLTRRLRRCRLSWRDVVVALGGRLLVENEDFFARVTAGILARHPSVGSDRRQGLRSRRRRAPGGDG